MRFVDLIPDSLVKSNLVTQLRLKRDASKNPERFDKIAGYSLGAIIGLGAAALIVKNNNRAFGL